MVQSIPKMTYNFSFITFSLYAQTKMCKRKHTKELKDKQKQKKEEEEQMG